MYDRRHVVLNILVYVDVTESVVLLGRVYSLLNNTKLLENFGSCLAKVRAILKSVINLIPKTLTFTIYFIIYMNW